MATAIVPAKIISCSLPHFFDGMAPFIVQQCMHAYSSFTSGGIIEMDHLMLICEITI